MTLVRARLGLAALSQQDHIPGIVMKGTSPIFYKVDVTTALVQAVATGTYPNTATTVHAYPPDIPRPNRRWSEGMKLLDNRQIGSSLSVWLYRIGKCHPSLILSRFPFTLEASVSVLNRFVFS